MTVSRIQNLIRTQTKNFQKRNTTSSTIPSSSSLAVPKILTSFINNECIPISISKDASEDDNLNKDYFINRIPSNGHPLCRVQIPTTSDINNAITCAQNGFASWSSLSGAKRSDILNECASILSKHEQDLVYWEALDSGIPISQVQSGHVDYAIGILKYYACLAGSGVVDEGRVMNGSDAGGHRDSFWYTRREPLGICAGIGPWNYPLYSMLCKISPALACGNAMIFKPSECTPVTAILLAQLWKDILPPGVLNVLPGDGNTGSHLVQHGDIAKVSFTGSTEVGIKVAQQSSATLKHLTLELGGKSPLLVLQDADLDNAVSVALLGNFINNGQVCSNCTRVYVHSSILDDFISQLLERTDALKLGNNMNPTTDIGPCVQPPRKPSSHFNKVSGFIQRAKVNDSSSTTLLCGGDGKVIDGGYFITPTIFLCKNDAIELVQKEIFGPVMSILPFESEEDLLNRANALPFGLAAGIVTQDVARAHVLAKKLQVGNVWINNYNLASPHAPFGPYKMSGYGKECGIEALDAYSHVQTVYVETGDVDCSW